MDKRAAGYGKAVGNAIKSLAREAAPSAVAGTAGYFAAPYIQDQAGITSDMGRQGHSIGNALTWATLANPRVRKYIMSRDTTANSLLKLQRNGSKLPVGNFPNVRTPTPIRGMVGLAGAAAAPTTVGAYTDLTKRFAENGVKFIENNPELINEPGKYVNNQVVNPAIDKLNNDVVKPTVASAKKTVDENAPHFLRPFGTMVGAGLGGSLGGAVVGRVASGLLSNVLLADDERLPYASRRNRERVRSLLKLIGTAGGGIGGMFLGQHLAGNYLSKTSNHKQTEYDKPLNKDAASWRNIGTYIGRRIAAPVARNLGLPIAVAGGALAIPAIRNTASNVENFTRNSADASKDIASMTSKMDKFLSQQQLGSMTKGMTYSPNVTIPQVNGMKFDIRNNQPTGQTSQTQQPPTPELSTSPSPLPVSRSQSDVNSPTLAGSASTASPPTESMFSGDKLKGYAPYAIGGGVSLAAAYALQQLMSSRKKSKPETDDMSNQKSAADKPDKKKPAPEKLVENSSIGRYMLGMASPGATALGGLAGAITAPYQGTAAESASRGALRGGAMMVGGLGGGLAGAAAGSLAGVAAKAFNPKLPVSNNDAVYGGLAGGAGLGTLAGAYLADRSAQKALGKPSWDMSPREKARAPDNSTSSRLTTSTIGGLSGLALLLRIGAAHARRSAYDSYHAQGKWASCRPNMTALTLANFS